MTPYLAKSDKCFTLQYVNIHQPSDMFPSVAADFQPGVRYHFSLYSCSSEPVQLLQRWQGYVKELGKSETEATTRVITV